MNWVTFFANRFGFFTNPVGSGTYWFNYFTNRLASRINWLAFFMNWFYSGPNRFGKVGKQFVFYTEQLAFLLRRLPFEGGWVWMAAVSLARKQQSRGIKAGLQGVGIKFRLDYRSGFHLSLSFKPFAQVIVDDFGSGYIHLGGQLHGVVVAQCRHITFATCQQDGVVEVALQLAHIP